MKRRKTSRFLQKFSMQRHAAVPLPPVYASGTESPNVSVRIFRPSFRS